MILLLIFVIIALAGDLVVYNNNIFAIKKYNVSIAI